MGRHEARPGDEPEHIEGQLSIDCVDRDVIDPEEAAELAAHNPNLAANSETVDIHLDHIGEPLTDEEADEIARGGGQ